MADLDQLDPGHAHGDVVPVALGAMHDDLILHAIEIVRQARHQGNIVAGDRGSGRERQRGSSAIADIGGFVASQLGEALADRLLQIEDIDERAGAVGHRLRDMRLP